MLFHSVRRRFFAIVSLASLGFLLCVGAKDAAGQCANLAPATFLQNTARCNPQSTQPSWEASGADYHEVRRQLFLAGDEGDIVALDPVTGIIAEAWCLPGDPDLEGLTIVDACSNLLYLVDEGSSAVYEFDTVTARIRRTFALQFASYEAITFVPDPASRHGGYFYLGIQTTGTIHVYELPLRDPLSNTATFVRTIVAVPPAWIPDYDFRDLDYDRDAQVLYAISRTNNLIVALDARGAYLDCWRLERLAAHEGIAVQGCTLYSAIDTSQWLVEVHHDFPALGVCSMLFTDRGTISAGTGGSVAIALDAGASFAGELYLVLGSASGTTPGFWLDGHRLPLNFDAYTELLLLAPNPSGAFAMTNFGVLDGQGRASTTLVVPPLPPEFVGVGFHHAACTYAFGVGVTRTSNSVPLCIR